MATNLVALSQDPILRFVDNANLPLIGGQLTTLVGGIPYPTYSDSNGQFPLPNPIILNNRGEVATNAGTSTPMYVSPNVAYTYILQDQFGNTIWTAPNIICAATTGAVLASLTQNYLNGIIDPITQAEQAANLSIVNFGYAPGNVLRYGTNTNPGFTDMTAAWQFAVLQAIQPSGASVYGPAGTYLIRGEINVAIDFPIEIYGDGAGVTTIIQTNDANVFNGSLNSGSTGRMYIHDLTLMAQVGSPMTQGQAITMQGNTTGTSPAKTLIVENVIITKSGGNDEFVYGIWTNACQQIYIDNAEFDGVHASTNSCAVHIEATGASSLAHTIVGLNAYDCNIGVDILTNNSPGVESVSLISCELVGVFIGVKAVNSLGIAAYAPPKIALSDVHIESRSNCLSLSNYTQISTRQCLFYRYGSLNNDPHINIAGCQFFDIDAQCFSPDSTQCAAINLDGTTSLVANGRLSGFFQGQPGTPLRVISAVGVIFNVRVYGQMNAYAGWIPYVLAPTYTNGGGLICRADDVTPPSADELVVQVSPVGTVLDCSYVQSKYVVVNLTSGTVTGAIAGYVGQLLFFECDSPGVVFQHNPSFIMPGGVDYVFTTGSVIQLYQYQTGLWRAVSQQ